MTTIYFMKNTLASMGLSTQFMKDKKVDVVFSAPEAKAIQMVRSFAMQLNTSAYVLDELRDVTINSDDTEFVIRHMFRDDNYHISGGESYNGIQERMIDALQMMVNDYANKTVVVNSHAFPISTVIEYFDSTFGYEDYCKVSEKSPYIVKLEFNGETCLSMEDILCV